jgi:transmembrane sensor
MKPFAYDGDDRRFDEASAWQVKIAADPRLELSAEFLAWIADHENFEAYNGVNTAWMAADDFAVEAKVLDMRQAALRRARQASTARWSRSPHAFEAIAAILLVAVLGGGAAYYFITAPDVYATTVGERRVIALEDGSRIALDSDTRVRVRYLKNARELDLDKGRAHFDVAHDVSRPFTVTAGDETVVAVGTSFDVEKIGSQVLVTLIQGKVVVRNADRAASLLPLPAPPPTLSHKPLSMRAGEVLVASAATPPNIKPVNLQVSSAWESGRLIFNGETLGEAVARENRYASQPIKVDPAIASIRIIGAFNAGDVSSFVSAITSYFPVQASTNADNQIVLEPKS